MRNDIRNFALLSILSLIPASPAFADEIPVNLHTDDHQALPAVDADAQRFVSVWQSRSDGQGAGIRARVFSSSSVPLTGEIAVNDYTAGEQGAPDVALRSDGGFVVTWHSDGSVGDDQSLKSVQARLFGADGQPLGPQFQANVWTDSNQIHPRVAVAPDDTFTLVWHSNGGFGADTDGSIQMRRFDATGAPLDSHELQANTTVLGVQSRPDVAIANDGGIFVVWESEAQDGDGTAVVGAWFDPSGAPTSSEVIVNGHYQGFQFLPAVTVLANGDAMVAWTSDGEDGDLGSIRQRRIRPDGQAHNQTAVNTYTTSDQVQPAIAALEDGGWVVTWSSDGSLGDDDGYYSVQARRFDAAGAPDGPEEQVNEYTPLHQWTSAVSASGDGWVVLWQSQEQDGDDEGIFGRRFAGPTLFADGFEGGTASRWAAH